MRRFLSALLACITALSMFTAVSFAENETSENVKEEIVFDYALVQTVSSRLSFSGTTANCKSETSGNSTVTSITATMSLEKQGFFWTWSGVEGASWTKTVNGNDLTISKTKSGLSSGTYRLKTVFTLTASSGTTETITVYSDEVTI